MSLNLIRVHFTRNSNGKFWKKKASVVVRFWKKKSKISNLNRIFFHIFWAKSVFWTSKRAQIQSKWRNWKIFHFSGKFSTSKNLQKKIFFAELHELEHSAEGTFFRKIGNFSTFSKNSKIRKIYLIGPTTEQSFSRNYFLEKKILNLNRIFFHIFWAKSENSKIAKIYFLWTSSEPILSKIFFRKKKASVVVGIWKKNPKISQISNLESDFFLILQKKPPMFQNIRNLFVLNFIWANFQQNQRTFFDQ